jgi:hypothetical protein
VDLFLALSVIFLLFINAVARSRGGNGAGRATLCSIAAAFLLSLAYLPETLPLSAFLVAAAGAVCWVVKARPRWFLVSSLGATAAAYVLIALPDLRDWHRLKKDFPVESLAERLAYEDRPRTASVPVSRVSNTASHSGSLDRLEGIMGEHYRYLLSPTNRRAQALEHLHAGVVKQFIESPGFGVGRRLRMPSRFTLVRELEERAEREQAIPQPGPAYSPLEWTPEAAKPTSESNFLSAHEDNTLNFLDPVNFGYIRNREHVAGFRPHRFRDAPFTPEHWRVVRLELVGLLKHEEPVAYVSANLPRMDELSNAPTRPLDAFEKKGLEGLRGGEDLMVQKGADRMRMLGSLRAAQQCVRCHRVQRGELLGAFSYLMSRAE